MWHPEGAPDLACGMDRGTKAAPMPFLASRKEEHAFHWAALPGPPKSTEYRGPQNFHCSYILIMLRIWNQNMANCCGPHNNEGHVVHTNPLTAQKIEEIPSMDWAFRHDPGPWEDPAVEPPILQDSDTPMV